MSPKALFLKLKGRGLLSHLWSTPFSFLHCTMCMFVLSKTCVLTRLHFVDLTITSMQVRFTGLLQLWSGVSANNTNSALRRSRAVSRWCLATFHIKALIVLNKQSQLWLNGMKMLTPEKGQELLDRKCREVVPVYGGSTDESLVYLWSPFTHETRLVLPNLPGSLVHGRRLFLRSSLGSWPWWAATEPAQTGRM